MPEATDQAPSGFRPLERTLRLPQSRTRGWVHPTLQHRSALSLGLRGHAAMIAPRLPATIRRVVRPSRRRPRAAAPPPAGRQSCCDNPRSAPSPPAASSPASRWTLLRAAVAWHVFEISGSAFHLGLIGLVQFVPALALTLVGGAVADAYDRSAWSCCSSWCRSRARRARDRERARHASLLASSTARSWSWPPRRAFEGPARAALLPQLVARSGVPHRGHAPLDHPDARRSRPAPRWGVRRRARRHRLAYALHAALMVAALIAMASVRLLPPPAPSGARRLAAIAEGLASCAGARSCSAA